MNQRVDTRLLTMSGVHEQEEPIEIGLLRKIAEGDRGSFRELYNRFSGVMMATAYKVLNDQTEAEDVLQDVFIQIWDKASLYDPRRGKPLTWALTLTRNKAIDRLRSAQRRFRLKDEVEQETKVFDQQNDADSVDEVYALEKGRLIREAVQTLSSEQRTAIELAFFKGLTQNEIAEQLNEPLGTIKARIRRGMLKLRDLLSDQL